MQEIDTRIAHSHHGTAHNLLSKIVAIEPCRPYYALLSIASAVLLTLSLYRFSAHYRSCSLWHATNMKAGYALHMSKTISYVYQFPFIV